MVDGFFFTCLLFHNVIKESKRGKLNENKTMKKGKEEKNEGYEIFLYI